MLSFVNWLTLSGAEQSGHRGPSTENQEAKQAALLCIKVKFPFISLSSVVSPCTGRRRGLFKGPKCNMANTSVLVVSYFNLQGFSCAVSVDCARKVK